MHSSGSLTVDIIKGSQVVGPAQQHGDGLEPCHLCRRCTCPNMCLHYYSRSQCIILQVKPDENARVDYTLVSEKILILKNQHTRAGKALWRLARQPGSNAWKFNQLIVSELRLVL